MKKPNLIFFMTDQQRYDTIGLHVAGKEVTPTWNDLGRNSTYFTHAYNTCPLCVPSRTALATGKNPFSTGMLINDWEGKYAQKNTTLHRYLHNNGYDVAHVGVNHIRVLPALKTSFPFAFWKDEEDYEKQAERRGLTVKKKPQQLVIVDENKDGKVVPIPYSNTETTLWPYELKEFKDVWFTDQIINFLHQKREKPFALFVCLWAPHPPLMVPREYLDVFHAEDFILPPDTNRPTFPEPRSRRQSAAAQLGSHIPQGGWREAWRAHCALSALCDDQLKRILDCVKEKKIENNTVVVCTTDHGEQLGEHRMYQKMEMYESSVRVPIMMHVPKTLPHVFNETISHLDLVPTILDLFGITSEDFSEGTSLKQSILKGVHPKEKDIYGVYCGNSGYGDMRRMVVSGPYKYVYDGIDSELFDLVQDPYELHNLCQDEAYQKLKNSLHENLKQWAEKQGDSFIQY